MKLNMSNNWLKGAEAGKALGDALAANTVLQELDLSGGKERRDRTIDAAFAKEFAVGLGVNGALTSLDISSNRLTQGRETFDFHGRHKGYEADMSGRHTFVYGLH